VKPNADFLFEASWEVCNKVGGIYTVVKSKAEAMLAYYGSNYYVIGPYFPGSAKTEFEEKSPPEFLRKAFDALSSRGLACHYGSWLVGGQPNCILIEFGKFSEKRDEVKKNLWEWFKVDSWQSPPDFDEPVVWAYAVGMLLQEISSQLPGRKIAIHCHEWLAGTAVLYLKANKARVGTVFTTHATVLGRVLAGNNVDLYSLLSQLEPRKEAYRFGVQAKHLLEKACCQNADVFTTVSEITAIEAEHLLERKADFLLPNGLDMKQFPTIEDAAIEHSKIKANYKKFLLSYFFPYYTFELDKTLIFSTFARYEFRNKGLDIFIRALAKLNDLLKEAKSDTTIVTFFFIPANVKQIKLEILENESFFKDIIDEFEEEHSQIHERLLYSIIAQKPVTASSILGEQTMFQIKKKVLRFLRQNNPPVCTHDLHDEQNDPILNGLREAKLQNSSGDRVKVIFYPIYLTGADQLLDLSYHEGIMGGHLGVFPSYYEPWGYTPLESAALGVASVTTDLAGFGRYICNECLVPQFPGIFVVKRFGRSDDEVVNELAEVLHRYSQYSKEERIQNKIEAKRQASLTDWGKLVRQYIEAQNAAVNKVFS